MLFNSYPFLLGFLPATLLAFALVTRFAPKFVVPLLAFASLAFYGWWNPRSLILLCASIVLNYSVALAMRPSASAGSAKVAPRRLLVLGIVLNLATLAYFKYAGFLVGIANTLSGAEFAHGEIILPLGISFFTFTQIAFLVDSCRDRRSHEGFGSYLLFVTFFPHLIAGPIYHHKEMLPQYARLAAYRLNARDLAVGATIFALGLFKKTVFADGIAPYSDHMFAAAAAGNPGGAVEAWCGATAYALQIYFDFSGYSDMAIGLARLFGIALPLNFSSPYKARSIIEFWRRWHMSLSRFLRDYLYIPLGGSRHGRFRTQFNLGITMLLGGLWHGANWTFVAWGAAHGLMLMVNHAWRAVRRAPDGGAPPRAGGETVLSVLLTFICVVFAWVLFRANSIAEAGTVYRAMAGMTSSSAADIWQRLHDAGAPWCALLLAIAWFAPNTQQMMGMYSTALPTYPEPAAARSRPARLTWRPDFRWAAAMAAVSVSALIAMTGSSRFLYFQF